ncbi:MAG: ATP-binding protein [Chlamydiales bacterium]|nr:ATP-binding protein [Chlamydiales bacterium]
MPSFKRFFQAPEKHSFFLFGPRGTGKSTWVKKHYPKALYLDLLMSDIRRRYESHPEELAKAVAALGDGNQVVIDEIQKIPDLLSIVHALIEEKRGIQFILTGSSSRKLKKKGVDLLAGRAINKEMHPFIASELQETFDLAKALKYGMLPLIWEEKDPAEVLESYVNLYVLEEVQYEGLVRNIGNFARFLSTIALSHGSLLNLTNISRECEVKRSTTENFLGILRDLLLSYEIPVFSKRAKRILTSHSKFYLFDSGVYRVMRKMGPLDSRSEVNGSALEGLVLQHLKAWCSYSKGKYEIFYWRTKAGLEVDFIIYGDDGFWAIEVKNSETLSPKDLRGLKHFIEDYPECKPVLLYRGKFKLLEDNILCIPCEVFLKQLVPNERLA